MKYCFFILSLVFTTLQSFSQSLKITASQPEIDLNSSLYIYTPDHKMTIEEVLQTQEWRQLPGAMLGLSKNTEWIKVNVQYDGLDTLNRVLYISYPMTKEIDVYYVADGKVLVSKNLGMNRHRDNNRYPQYRGFSAAIPIVPNQESTFYIRLNNQYRWLRATMFLMTGERLNKNALTGEGLIWFWRGIFLFAGMLSILLYLKVRLRLFLYYLIANAGFLVFIATEVGDFHQIVGIDTANNAIALNNVGSTIAVYFFPLFLNELVNIRGAGPRLWKWTFYILNVRWILVALVIIPYFRDTMALYYTSMVLMISALLIVIIQNYLLFRVMRKEGGLATLIFLIYLLYTIGVLLNALLPSLGLLTDTPITFFTILIISCFQIVAFLFVISNEALNIYKERAILMKKIQSHQKDLVAAIVKSQEEERNSIGRELHDLIGANLSIMKQKVGSVNVELEKIIVNSIEAVRRLSHGLSTPKVEENEFKDEVIQLCNLFQTEERSIKPYFHKWPIFKDKEITTNIFRICQELLQNANKHSLAKNVFLQFIGEEGNKCSIIYEDDGVGFEYPQRKSTGLGIRNIENRVSLINGSIQYDTSSKQHGTTIFIEF